MPKSSNSIRTQRQTKSGVSDADRARDRARAGIPRDEHRRREGTQVHQALARVAEQGGLVSFDSARTLVTPAKRRGTKQPAESPVKGAALVMASRVMAGAAMLPPPEWTLLGVEVEYPGCRADQVWLAPDPVIVADHIGEVLIIEIKNGGHHRISEFSDVREQARTLFAAGAATFGERFLGVAQVMLETRSQSRLLYSLHEEPLELTDGLIYPFGTRSAPIVIDGTFSVEWPEGVTRP